MPESPPFRGSDESAASFNGKHEVPVPSAAEVQTQLERILSSPLFASSESLRAFLRFTVHRTLEGRGDELKEYLLGVEVFRRGAQFDPRLDSIVRVQGSKIRAKLREYYETLGKDDPVLIELPKGTYVPVLRSRTNQELPKITQPARPSRYTYKLLLAVGSALAVIAFALAYTGRQRSGSPPVETRLLQLTFDSGLTTDPALSPDGKLVAYVSDRGGGDHLDLWVQPIQGGAALRLTHGPADVREPAFSSDGSSIVFRSDDEPGGLYLVSVLGGEPRRIAPKGRRPRFSPDGQQIAYWAGKDVYGTLYVLPVGGGAPRRVSEGFNHSTYPVWTPNGRHLLFWGNNSETYKDMDWWVVPLAGGAAVRTGLAKVLAQHQLEPDVRSVGDWTWFHNNLVLSARQADSTNLWSIPISPETFQITGRPQRLTFGAGEDVLPSIAPDGRIVFATLRKNVQIWSLPADVNAGVIRGAIEQLTTDTVSKRWPAISPDGRFVVFTAPRGGRDELWLRDLRTGQERTVATGIVGVFSKDGSEIAFGPPFPRHGEKVGIYVVRTQDGVPEKICEECGYPTDWSHDSRRIMYNISPRGDPSWLDLKSGEKHGFLRHRVYALWDGQFSPDDRWVAFGALKHEGPVQIFVAPFPDGTGSHENAWIPITDGSADAGHLVWSPDGRLLYFASDRDGRMCLWAQALDQSMRPRGPAIAILHLHGPRRSIENMPWNQFRLSTSRDTLLFNLGELTGNIWMTRLGQK